MSHQRNDFWIAEVISNYPIPRARHRTLWKTVNLFIISSILPIIGYSYVKAVKINPAPGYPLELLLSGIVAFFFFYGASIVFVSGRIREFLVRIKPILDLDEEKIDEFSERTQTLIFNPPRYLLTFFLGTTILGQYSLMNSGVIHGDLVIMCLIFLMILLSGFFNWVGAWALITFFQTVRKFFTEIPVKINPFNPDRIGGLEPISELVTLGLLIISILAAITIPIWYLFSRDMSTLFALITSVVIPTYLYLSMREVYTSLRTNKIRTLLSIADELELIYRNLEQYISKKHDKEVGHEDLIRLSSELSAISRVYNTVDRMRTFPVNTRTILKVVSTMLVPIISLIMTRLAEEVWRLVF